MNASKMVQQLSAQGITPEGFRRYGQAIYPSQDGKPYDADDAQLKLQNGIPRFYIMRLHQTGRKFHSYYPSRQMYSVPGFS